jgi:hypothetical protein
MKIRWRELSLAALLALSLAAAPAIADQPKKEAAAESHVPFDVPTRDNFDQLVYNHFGNPSAGQAVIDTWIRQTYSDLDLPLTAQGFGQAIRLHNVKRIAIRVILHTRGGSIDDDATGPNVNSGNIGNPRLFTATSPTISSGFGGEPVTQFCTAWTEVRFAIRWTDDTLTSDRALIADSDLWNDNCYFLEG